MVMALDDLQWADPTSLQLVASLFSRTASAPLLLVLTMRPDQESRAWSLCQQLLTDGAQHVLDLALTGLDADAADELLTQLAPTLPPHLRRHIIARVGDTPLFLVESVRTLEAQGLLSGQVDPQHPLA